MGRPRSQPVAGYASKSEAILALSDEGFAPAMIAEKIGSTSNSVVTRLAQLRRGRSGTALRNKGQRRDKPAPDTRGIWTAQKLDKAHRLFGKTMLLIAEALEVPPKELMEYGLKGLIPPMGEGQRVAQLLDEQQGEPAPAAERGEPPLALPSPDVDPQLAAAREETSPTREEDEADLAALDSAASPIAPVRKYRIYDPAREGYLLRNKSGWGSRANAWQGTAVQLEALLRERPELKELDPERVP